MVLSRPSPGVDTGSDPVTVTVADPRLLIAVVVAATASLLFVVSGRAEFVATAAPFAVLAVLGLRPGPPPRITVRVDAPPRVTEGECWNLVIEVESDGPCEVRVRTGGVSGHRREGADIVHGLVPDRGTFEASFGHRALRWGRQRPSPVEVLARRPGGWLVGRTVVSPRHVVRVLPSRDRLATLLPAERPRTTAGAHLARSKGAGSDFADLRPYRPGDRLRDVSWSATARAGTPWVVEHHPDRSGAVVVVLDGFTEGAPEGALDRAARAVWSLAHHHVDAGDRVGLLVAAPTVEWLAPVAGHRARLQIVDALLNSRAAMARSTPRLGGAGRWHAPPLPPDAVVVGVSALESDAFVAEMARHRRAGHRVAVLGVATEDLLAPAGDEAERAARRLWRLQVDQRRRRLHHAGIPTVARADASSTAVRALVRSSLGRPSAVGR